MVKYFSLPKIVIKTLLSVKINTNEINRIFTYVHLSFAINYAKYARSQKRIVLQTTATDEYPPRNKTWRLAISKDSKNLKSNNYRKCRLIERRCFHKRNDNIINSLSIIVWYDWLATIIVKNQIQIYQGKLR